MKILSLFLLLSLSAVAQKQKYYLEIDDAITIANRNDAVGAYEFRLGIHHQSTKNDTDYYNFIAMSQPVRLLKTEALKFQNRYSLLPTN
jgi:hypothetical protein